MFTQTELISEFKRCAAKGGIEEAADFALGLCPADWNSLLSAIQEGGAGWIAAWLELRKAAAEGESG